MYTGSDNGLTEIYMVPNIGLHGQAENMTNEVAPEVIYDQGLYYPAASYYGYYCTGTEMQGEWSDQQRVFGLDGQDLHYSAWQTENSPYVYYPPNYGYAQPAYNPYNPCIPGAIVGFDSPIIGTQQSFPLIAQPNLHAVPSISNRQSTGSKYSQPHISSNGGAASQNDVQSVTSGSIAQIAQNPSKVSSSILPNFGSSFHGWTTNDRFRTRFQLNGTTKNGNNDLILNEQNKGPRTNKSKDQSSSDGAQISKIDESVAHEAIIICASEYNRDNFPIDYPDAKFFIIKSYSEDDVHKSIKYNVWSSTPNGNRKLNNAYQDAHKTSEKKQGNISIFLFFSVNASGQFCGVAEMAGSVEFDKNMDFWQQDKWNGSFPVKWHIIKDVPNTSFRHIILENNENKPVTNSRDTQEIMYAQGMIMLKIFKDSPLTTSILDDFMFYEERQKIMHEEKSKYARKSRTTYLPAIVSTNNPNDSAKQTDSVDQIAKNGGGQSSVSSDQPLKAEDKNLSSDDDQNENSKEESLANTVIKMESLSVDSKEKVTVGSITIEVNNRIDIPTESSNENGGER